MLRRERGDALPSTVGSHSTIAAPGVGDETVPVLAAGMVILMAVGFGFGPRLSRRSARWLPLILALAGAALGIGALLFELLGPSYAETVISTIGSGPGYEGSSTRSLLEVGLQPLTAVVIALDALGFGTVLIGAVIRARGRHPAARWLMLAGIVPPLVIGSISFGLADAVPGVLVSLAATILAFSTPNPGTTQA